MFHLDVSYQNGRGAQKDLRLAEHFYRLAAAQHHVATQYNLAAVMANGKGVKSDLKKALALILIAKKIPASIPMPD